MSPEEVKELQRTYQARRSELYREHPEAERFMKRKSQRLKFLLLYCLGITLGRAVLLGIEGETGPVLLVAAVVMGFGMNAIFLAAGMGFKWTLAFLLYGWALYSLWRLLSPLIQPGADFLVGLVWAFIVVATSFSAAPAAAVLDLLTVVFFVLVLATAAWLTLPPKNRRLAEECEALEEQWKAYIASNPVEKSK